jgi:hypothetical protein
MSEFLGDIVIKNNKVIFQPNKQYKGEKVY